MAKPLTNLSIRVNIPEEKEYVVKKEVEILWGRIWGAGIGVLVFIGVIVGALLAFGSDDAAFQPVKSPELRVADKFIAEAPVAPVKIVPVAVAGVVKPLPAEVPVVTMSPGLQSQGVASNIDMTTPALVAEVAPLEIIEAKVEVAQTLAASDLVPATVATHSEHLLRAALTTEMKGRQPAKGAPAVLQVSQGELLTVYFFTELKGLRKQTVHYDWFRNEKRVARVKIRPRFDTTGNFSSKYIDRNMRGQWRVVAKTAGGELLATAQFEVR